MGAVVRGEEQQGLIAGVVIEGFADAPVFAAVQQVGDASPEQPWAADKGHSTPIRQHSAVTVGDGLKVRPVVCLNRPDEVLHRVFAVASKVPPFCGYRQRAGRPGGADQRRAQYPMSRHSTDSVRCARG